MKEFNDRFKSEKYSLETALTFHDNCIEYKMVETRENSTRLRDHFFVRNSNIIGFCVKNDEGFKSIVLDIYGQKVGAELWLCFEYHENEQIKQLLKTIVNTSISEIRNTKIALGIADRMVEYSEKEMFEEQKYIVRQTGNLSVCCLEEIIYKQNILTKEMIGKPYCSECKKEV